MLIVPQFGWQNNLTVVVQNTLIIIQTEILCRIFFQTLFQIQCTLFCYCTKQILGNNNRQMHFMCRLLHSVKTCPSQYSTVQLFWTWVFFSKQMRINDTSRVFQIIWTTFLHCFHACYIVLPVQNRVASALVCFWKGNILDTFLHLS